MSVEMIVGGADNGQQLQGGFQPVVESVSDDYNFYTVGHKNVPLDIRS